MCEWDYMARVGCVFAYGHEKPAVTHGSNHMRFVASSQTLRLTTDASLAYALSFVLLWLGKHPQNEDDEASHVCGNPRCVNYAHLVWERHAVNHEREGCHKYGEVCKHVPRCLPPHVANNAYVKRHLEAAKKRKKNNV